MAKQRDLSALFGSAFAKYEALKGRPQQSSYNGPNFDNLPDMRAASVDSDILQKAHDASLHPEKQGQKRLMSKREKEEAYKFILKSITLEEYENLRYLVNAGGYSVIAKSTLIAIGEEGESLDTERLEQWGLIKRDKIDDELFQFTIKSLGRRVLGDVEKILRTQ